MKLPIILSLLCINLTSLAQAEDWTQYRGPQSDGTSTEKLNLSKFKSELKQVWKKETPLGFSSFAVADGKAFTIIAKDKTEVCVALDAKTGETLWQTKIGDIKFDGGGNAGARGNRGGDGPRSTPSTDGKYVYTYNGFMKLDCLNAKDGSIVWSRDILKEHNGRNIRWQNASSPLLEGDMIYVAGGGPGESLLGINKKNGKVVWKKEDHLMTHATPIAATIHKKRQIIFFTQKGLIALQPKTGKKLWEAEFPYRTSTAASPVVYKDIVYCSAGYSVGAGAFKISYKKNKFSVSTLWTKPNKLMNHWSTPVVRNGYLYGMFSFKKYGIGPVQCVDIKTGSVIWSEKGFGPGNCILVDGHLIALSDAGELVTIEATPKKYVEVSKQKILEGKCWSTPVISHGMIYARSTQEAVCLKAK